MVQFSSFQVINLTSGLWLLQSPLKNHLQLPALHLGSILSFIIWTYTTYQYCSLLHLGVESHCHLLISHNWHECAVYFKLMFIHLDSVTCWWIFSAVVTGTCHYVLHAVPSNTVFYAVTLSQTWHNCTVLWHWVNTHTLQFAMTLNETHISIAGQMAMLYNGSLI